MKISLVISTYNRGPQLVRTLDSVARQTLPAGEWELIVIDNNSADDTQGLFRRFAAANPGIDARIVPEKRQGLSHARNRGIAEARFPIIVMIDDDEEINPGFLGAYDAFFESHPDAQAAGGKMVACYEMERPKWMSRYTEALAASTIDLGNRIIPFRRGRYPIGGNMAFRREVFEKYGVFNTELGRRGDLLIGGEEKDMFSRIARGGGRIYWVPGAVADHIIPPSRVTKARFCKQARMAGVSERIRTKSISVWAYFKALVSEKFKWAATLCLYLWFLVCQQPLKGHYLMIMRRSITAGLLKGK